MGISWTVSVAHTQNVNMVNKHPINGDYNWLLIVNVMIIKMEMMLIVTPNH